MWTTVPPFALLLVSGTALTFLIPPDPYGAELAANLDRKLSRGQANQLVAVDALHDPGQILDITFGVARIGVSINVTCYELFPDLGSRIGQFRNSVLVRGRIYWVDLRCFRFVAS